MVRIVLAVVLASVALGLFLLNRPRPTQPPPPSAQDLSATINDIDLGIDSVLAQFHIERSWVRKRAIAFPNRSGQRIERRVRIPKDILTISINLALNSMVQRYHGRAIASENLKENTVTIHIELLGYIVQTIIFKLDSELKRNEKALNIKIEVPVRILNV